jgi:hypothetical protein
MRSWGHVLMTAPGTRQTSHDTLDFWYFAASLYTVEFCLALHRKVHCLYLATLRNGDINAYLQQTRELTEAKHVESAIKAGFVIVV